MIEVRAASRDELAMLIGWSDTFLADLVAATSDPWFIGATLVPGSGQAMLVEALERGMLLVAELEGLPAGYMLARLERPFIVESPIREIGHISQVYVVPEARRRGVAAALVAAAETMFRERGISWVQLSYQPSNRAAAASWAALGFAPFRVYARKRLE